MNRIFSFIITLFIVSSVFAADPTATNYTYSQCQGTYMPYPEPQAFVALPDSLTPVYINHLGRHGSRFPSSATNTRYLRSALEQAKESGTITAAGNSLLELTRYVEDYCNGRWGALDSLGMAEQRGLASRMMLEFPSLFENKTVSAISSYAPRCVMSMYEFTHQLDRLNNRIEIYTSAGRQNSPLLRPFDDNADYKAYIDSKVWETPYEDYMNSCVNAAPLRRILGNDFAMRREEIPQLVMAEYGFLASLAAMSLDVDLGRYFTRDEINALWSVSNLRLYLRRATSTLSSEPSEIAAPLLVDFIKTTDEAIAGDNPSSVNLRFGHAETLLPLLGLLRLQGCYYLTNYFDTVGQHWRDFAIVPMAANFRIVLLRSAKGRYYVRCDLNETPVPLMPNDPRVVIPWSEARAYMMRCLPLVYQF